MKKLFGLLLVVLFTTNTAFCATKYYKMNEYNSRGQKTGYTKVYYQNDRTNVKKVEKYSTSGKRTNLYR